MKSVITSVILERSVLFKRQKVNIFIFKMVDNYFLKYTELLHPKQDISPQLCLKLFNYNIIKLIINKSNMYSHFSCVDLRYFRLFFSWISYLVLKCRTNPFFNLCRYIVFILPSIKEKDDFIVSDIACLPLLQNL